MLMQSIDPDEAACHEPSHQDLHSLPFYFSALKLLFQQWYCPNTKIKKKAEMHANISERSIREVSRAYYPI